jgi:glycosyltransferase involved in cell wall biosynthesis
MWVRHVYRDVFPLVPGGIERHVLDLASSTAAQVQVEVVGGARRPWPRRWDQQDGLVVRAVAEAARIGGVPLAPGLPAAVASHRPDIVHHHGPNPTGELALPLRRRATVATWHCDPHRWAPAHRTYAAIAARALGTCQRVLVSSERLLHQSEVLARVVDREPGVVSVVPFGVDVERFSPAPDRADGPGPAAGRPPVVLFVGRLRAYKGLEVLVSAMRHLDATLVVAGDGPERPRLESLGRAVLGHRIRVLGPVPDEALPGIYRSADVLCLPSTTGAEAFGIVLLEAMACGIPVISTEVGTATSVVNRDGETGLVVPPGDSTALADALERVLGDPGVAVAMGRAGRDHVTARHDLRAMAAAVLAIYRQVV